MQSGFSFLFWIFPVAVTFCFSVSFLHELCIRSIKMLSIWYSTNKRVINGKYSLFLWVENSQCIHWLLRLFFSHASFLNCDKIIIILDRWYWQPGFLEADCMHGKLILKHFSWKFLGYEKFIFFNLWSKNTLWNSTEILSNVCSGYVGGVLRAVVKSISVWRYLWCFGSMLLLYLPQYYIMILCILFIIISCFYCFIVFIFNSRKYTTLLKQQGMSIYWGSSLEVLVLKKIEFSGICSSLQRLSSSAPSLRG